MFPPAQSRSHILRTGAKPRERNNTILRRAFGEAGSVRKDYLTGSVPCTPHEGFSQIIFSMLSLFDTVSTQLSP